MAANASSKFKQDNELVSDKGCYVKHSHEGHRVTLEHSRWSERESGELVEALDSPIETPHPEKPRALETSLLLFPTRYISREFLPAPVHPCLRCGVCCTGPGWTCGELVVRGTVGEVGATRCRVYESRVEGMTIPIHADRPRTGHCTFTAQCRRVR